MSFLHEVSISRLDPLNIGVSSYTMKEWFQGDHKKDRGQGAALSLPIADGEGI